MPASTLFIIYMNFVVSSIGFGEGEMHKGSDQERYFVLRELIFALAKITSISC